MFKKREDCRQLYNYTGIYFINIAFTKSKFTTYIVGL